MMRLNNSIDPQSESSITQAARELLDRYGTAAVEQASARAAALASASRWPEHAMALRVLTAVEELVGRL
jgi:hypothetical protein